MSKLNLYSIYDNKVGSYTLPFCAPNIDVAKRSVSLAMLNDDILKHFATDYDLVCVGSFDSSSGLVDGVGKCTVCSLSDVISDYPLDKVSD